jgi:hypothetical protein
VEEFRQRLAEEIRRVLAADMAVIRESDIPIGWAPNTYKHFKERTELWYNSTLLVSLIGRDAGFIITCGDGGLVLRKIESGVLTSKVPVRSTNDLSVSGVVSLAPDALRFTAARISLSASTQVQIIISTDGIDRSLRREANRDDVDFDPYGSDFLDSQSSQDLSTRMIERLNQIVEPEMDNISIAVLHWPPPPLRQLERPSYQGRIAAAEDTIGDIIAHGTQT